MFNTGFSAELISGAVKANMQMKTGFPLLAVSAGLILASILLICGCTAPQEPRVTETGNNTGIQDITQTTVAVPGNLSIAYGEFLDWKNSGFTSPDNEDASPFGDVSKGNLSDNRTPVPEIRFIRAMNLSSEGTSVTWLFGIRAANASFLAEKQAEGWRVQPLPIAIPEVSLNISSLLQPQDILEKNPDITQEIFSSGNPRVDLALEGETYTITSQANGTYQTWAFDGKTGTVISRP